jgi:hypothetical protein
MAKTHESLGFEQKPESLVERFSPVAALRRALETHRNERKTQRLRKVFTDIVKVAAHH